VGDLKTYNYGFNIPPTAQILGISVYIRKSQKYNTHWILSDHSVQLMYGGVPIGISNLTQQGVPWDTNWETTQYGNGNDLWGHNWTVNEITDQTFGVRYLPQVDGTPPGAPTGNAGYLDCIEVIIHYYNETN